MPTRHPLLDFEAHTHPIDSQICDRTVPVAVICLLTSLACETQQGEGIQKCRPTGVSDKLIDITIPWHRRLGQLYVNSPVIHMKHKSSGSEFPLVICLCPSETPLFGKRNDDPQPPLDDLFTRWTGIRHDW